MAELQRMINKILVPLDGSDGGYKAVKMALVIVKSVIAKIIVLNVIQASTYSMASPEYMSPILPQDTFVKVEEKARGYLQRIVELGSESVDVQ